MRRAPMKLDRYLQIFPRSPDTRPSVASSGRARRRGQALVEFAMMLPVVVALLLGVLDLGPVFFTYEAIANGAREAARQCAVTRNLTNSQLGTIASNETNGTLTITAVSVPTCNASLLGGNPVTVTVTTVYTPVIGFFAFWTGPQTLTASATMVVWN